MTRREAAIVSAYTGITMGNFGDLIVYVNTLFDTPIFDHHLSQPMVAQEIKRRSEADFLALEIEG